MTNHNPASSNSPSSKLSQEILAKVNAHADRSIDRLFADIDELLSGDLSEDMSSSNRQQRYHYPTESVRTDARMADPQPQPQYQQYPPQPEFTPSQQPVEPPQPQSKPKPLTKNHPSWMKVFVGIGVISIALSSLLLWLINERKIQLPKNMDTSWLPFQSQSQISADDAKFAEYMRKSIAKIESANAPTNSTTTAVNSATANPGTIASTAPANTPNVPISLIKTLQTGDRPGAIFEINSQTQTVYAGEKIGTSDWSLLTVAKEEVIVKKTGGVIRSIYVGQKF